MNKMKKKFAFCIIFTIILSLTLSPILAESFDEKEEVVYGLLDFEGRVESLYVVNRFFNGSIRETGGAIIDYGSYTDIQNMTSSEEIYIDGDKITINTSAEQFFYQGTLVETDLPWNISIAYTFDGDEISSTDLAGKSGNFEILIDIVENPTLNSAFFDNYLLQVSLTLDTENFTAIESPNGSLASAGRNRIITHTVMPGEDASIAVNGTANQFVMEEIKFSALRFSMDIDIPVAGVLIEDANTLSESVAGLHEGIVSLNSGIADLSGGAENLNSGASEFGQGLSELSRNSDHLLSSSRQIHGALDQISNQLNEQENPASKLEELPQLAQGLREMASGLEEMAKGIDELKKGYRIAYTELDAAILAIPDREVDPTPLYGALVDDKELTASLNQLMKFYFSAKTTKGTYEAVKESFQLVEPALQSFSESLIVTRGALLEMADNIEEFLSTSAEENPIQELIDGMTALSQNYQRFHTGLDNYLEGVEDLSNGYQEIHGGISSLRGGLNNLSAGADELDEGSGELNTAVADLPNTLQEEMARGLALYDTSGFEPVSFVSEKNTAISSVQFVLRTPAIELPGKPEPEMEEAEKLSFWQKLLKLFGLYGD